MDIYTDGSCINHAGMGAWSYIKTQDGLVLEEKSGVEKAATHIRMELMAVYAAVKGLQEGTIAAVFTDSRYIVDTINEAKLERWMAIEFKTKKGTRAHADLWRLLAKELALKSVTFSFVPAHTGVPFNERADKLARLSARAAARSEAC